MLGFKDNSLKFLMEELDITEKELYAPTRNREYTYKRWIMMWFYRCAGKTYSEIARKLHKDHTSVIYGCKSMDDTIKAIAEEYLQKYVSEVLQKDNVNFEKTPKTLVKVPDYRLSKVVYREVESRDLEKKEPVKPHWSKRKWDR